MKKIIIMLMALLMIGSVSAIGSDLIAYEGHCEKIQWFPFMSARCSIYANAEITRMSDVPNILDNVNAIINDIYQIEFLSRQKIKPYNYGGCEGNPLCGAGYRDTTPKPPEPEPLAGDLNGDGQVDERDRQILEDGYGTIYDVFDLAELGNQWTGNIRLDNVERCSGLNITENPDCDEADLNGDGMVDVFDLAIVGNNE